MKVIKFGGSSLASAEQLHKVLAIVRSDAERKFVVVSAPGKRSPEDEKVTDLLIQYGERHLAKLPVADLQAKIIQRYADMCEELHLQAAVLAEIKTNILQLATIKSDEPERVMDAFKASGENNNAKLVAAYFAEAGLPASYVDPKTAGLIVSDEPGNARLLPSSMDKLYKLRELPGVIVIPGFFGYTEAGDICTFSRGGSDITGSLIAAGVKADVYENFTDVDAIFAAHPGIVRNPQAIDEMTYREMRELAYAGFAVFHDEALMPAYRAGVPVQIKNTNNPAAQGTRIVVERKLPGKPVVGIASDAGFASIYISKYLMNRELGFGRKVLQILEDLALTYEHMPSGIDDISIILRERQLTPEIELELLQRLEHELQLDKITITHNLTLIMIVGEGMKSNIGVAAQSTASLAEHKINLEMINQGSSEVSIMFGIKSQQEKQAIRALYNAFFN